MHLIIRIRDATSASVSLQQEKDADIAYYKSTIQELNEQVNYLMTCALRREHEFKN